MSQSQRDPQRRTAAFAGGTAALLNRTANNYPVARLHIDGDAERLHLRVAVRNDPRAAAETLRNLGWAVEAP